MNPALSKSVFALLEEESAEGISFCSINKSSSIWDAESFYNSDEFLISLSSESSLMVWEEFSFICYIADYLW